MLSSQKQVTDNTLFLDTKKPRLFTAGANIMSGGDGGANSILSKD
jgi:hypothetical protein